MINLNYQYQINNYRIKKLNGKFLLTTDHGSWLFLTSKEFVLLESHLVHKNLKLFKKLEEVGIIITLQNKKNIINSLRERYNYLSPGPSLHILIPTLRCNLKCIYCHASSKPIDAKGFDMDEVTAKKTVDFIFQTPSPSITIEFQGGEPLLKFDLIKYIIAYSKNVNKRYKKNVAFSVVTNLTLMDEEKFNYFLKEEIGICTSLDGQKSLHDNNRHFSNKTGTHETVEKWIKRFNEAYEKKGSNLRTNALITITRKSLGYSKQIVDEYISLGLKTLHLRFLNNLGDARPVWNNIGYSSDEFIKFWKNSVDYIFELNKKGVKIRERTIAFMAKKTLTGSDANFLDMRTPCGAIIGQLAYTPDGSIYTCDEARMTGDDLFKVGNVVEDTYKKVLSSDKSCSMVMSSINDCQICDSCVYKPYCGICPVCNYMEQGSIVANIPETSRCKIYMAQFDYIFSKLSNPKEVSILKSWIDEMNKKI